MPAALLQALPLRLIGIMKNEMLLAIPFFTLMGLILDRCGLARDLLETIGQVFGPVRGGLAFAVISVGALLGATTGVIAASVISMGLFSLPLMLRHGYDPRWPAGVIAASGSLTQIVPPSLVLIVLADQLDRSVGDMYAAALAPAAMIIVGYPSWSVLAAWWFPRAMPALPVEARAPSGADGSQRARSLGVLVALGALGSAVFMQAYPALVVRLGRTVLGAADRREGDRRPGGDRRLRLRAGARRPRPAPRLAVDPGAARGLRADAAVDPDLPGSGHDLSRRGHADRRRRAGRARRAGDGSGATPAARGADCSRPRCSSIKLSCFVIFILIGSTDLLATPSTAWRARAGWRGCSTSCQAGRPACCSSSPRWSSCSVSSSTSSRSPSSWCRCSRRPPPRSASTSSGSACCWRSTCRPRS